MVALAGAGREPDALAQHQAFRRRLGDQLGLEPSASLRRLEGRILRHELGVRGDDDPAAGPGRAEGASGMPPGSAPRRVEGPGLDRLAVRYLATDDGPALAVGEVGDGPPLVVVPAWVTSLDVIARGRDPRSSLLERLVGRFHLTLYDRRGTGLTGGELGVPSLDRSVHELEQVAEDVAGAAGGPVPLLAFSQSGPVVVALAARRPDLVQSLVVFGSYADGPGVFGDEAVRSSVLSMVEAHWGLGARLLADLYRPGASDDAARHLSRVLRESATGAVAAAYLREVYDADVASELAGVRAPTLVLHYRGDRVIPFRGGEQLARGIPGARLVPLEGEVHLPDAHDLDRIEALIREHLGSR